MMADIQEDEILSEIDAVSEEIKEQSAESSESQANQPVADEIPEKYRNKPLKQIVEELEHANKSMGRYANELGEVRRLADELIKSQLKPTQQAEQPKEVDFFENPQEAIRRAVESNPRVQQAEQSALMVQRAMAQQRLAQLHPDFGNVVQDAEFAKWVGESKIRTRLFKEAEGYDVDAADELLSTYKQLKMKKVEQQASQVSEVEKSARKQTMQAASVETGGTGEVTRKIFRRADLINLRLRDPQKFAAMQDEIDAAYRENRVK